MGNLFLQEFTNPDDYEDYYQCRFCETLIATNKSSNNGGYIWGVLTPGHHLTVLVLARLINIRLETDPALSATTLGVHCVKCLANLGWTYTRHDLRRPEVKVTAFGLKESELNRIELNQIELNEE